MLGELFSVESQASGPRDQQTEGRLGGVAGWELGRSDVRVYEEAGGELDPGTRRNAGANAGLHHVVVRGSMICYEQRHLDRQI
jgi:hypothetical protein